MDCGSAIPFTNKPKTGSLVNCTSCGTELQVVWLDPLELDWPFIDDYDDFEDDDDFYDDDDDDFYDDDD
jgi:lysine biosynthesis protein LysW